MDSIDITIETNTYNSTAVKCAVIARFTEYLKFRN